MHQAPLIFALHGAEGFGAAVARELGTALSAHEERDFDDGEHKARPLAEVRGHDVFAVHSLHGADGVSPDRKLLRLLFFLGALRDAGAASVTAVVPYLAYARKDQKSQPRDPVTTRYVARFFEAVGACRVLTLDVHNLAAFQNAFRISADNLEAAPVLARECARLVGGEEVVVVSPDAGGIKRAERFRQALAGLLGRAVGSAFAEKHRAGGELRGEALVGAVAGRMAIIVDDLIAAGHTVDRAARACREHGAGRVIVAASHGLFVGDAPRVLAAAPIERFIVSDSVDRLPAAAAGLAARITRVAVAPLFAQEMRPVPPPGGK